MCGVAGFSTKNLNESEIQELVKVFGSELSHRGSDSSGSHISKKYALVHNRLSIRGNAEASQPIQTKSGRYHITYNGEIYNLDYLVRELELIGANVEYPLSDTYVLSLWVNYFGVKRFSAIEGTFAFAILDHQQNILHLCRDRLGVKPLFYCKSSSSNQYSFAFASELGTLVRSLRKDFQVSLQFLSEYMWFGSGCGENTIYEDIFSVQPGTTLSISGDDIKISKWFDLNQFYIDNKSCVYNLDERLKSAVNRQTVSDRPVGLFLSGGVDSSLIASLFNQQAKNNIFAFTAIFDSGDTNESEIASDTANRLGLGHDKISVSVNAVELTMRRLLHSYGEPFGDPAGIPLLKMCDELKKKDIKVVIQGDGGDELFSGYLRYQFLYSKAYLILKMMPWRLVKLMSFESVRSRIRRLWELSQEPFPIMSALLLTEETKGSDPFELFEKNMRNNLYEKTDPFLEYKLKEKELSYISSKTDRQMLIDLQIQLRTQFLPKVDRASMAAGIEARVPLLDELVLGASFSLKQSNKTNWLFGKVVLRKLLDKMLPKNTLNRKKKGFSTPYGQWLSNDLYDRCRELILQDDFIGYFNFSKVSLSTLLDIPKNKLDHRMFMRWKLFVLALWYDEFLRRGSDTYNRRT
jgi:asparagine synthase (glutamine-hydrolysing)